AYDALEFDNDLIQIDELYDIAFLVMDLWHHGFWQEANEVWNRYMGLTGDYASAFLMPLYCSLRAGVRGMVAALRGNLSAANAYLMTGTSFLFPMPHPDRILIAGRSGTGKTTIAAALAPKCLPPPGAVHMRSDIIRKRMKGQLPEVTLPPEAYSATATMEVYCRCADAFVSVAGKHPVILDVALAAKTQDISSLDVLKAEKIWLTAPEEVLKQRMTKRLNDASDATIDVMATQRAAPPSKSWHVVDASGTVEQTIDQIVGDLPEQRPLQ
ncbi:MAG: AAA family ATPase, partial [Pseudomonadota bacterium]